MREPAVAGQFYSGDKKLLSEQVKKSYLHELGFGKLPKIGNKRSIKGIVAPHAGFMYSGPVASHSYGTLAEDGFPKTFVIIGPNHSGMGQSVALTTKSFKMPWGTVPVDLELAKKLQGDVIKNDDNAHRYEHSLEVQLPFLSQIQGDFQILPITMASQGYKISKQVGELIGKALKGKDVVVIASTDFTHCGTNYGHRPPPGMNAGEFAAMQDRSAIDAILEMEPKKLIQTVQKNNITMCGYGCVAVMLFATKIMGAKEASLLKYATSYDISPGSNAVGYGALIVK